VGGDPVDVGDRHHGREQGTGLDRIQLGRELVVVIRLAGWRLPTRDQDIVDMIEHMFDHISHRCHVQVCGDTS
jgi:hypothetical protein